MSIASAEEAFHSQQSLETAHAFKMAAANGVTVLGATGDNGTAKDRKFDRRQGG